MPIIFVVILVAEDIKRRIESARISIEKFMRVLINKLSQLKAEYIIFAV